MKKTNNKGFNLVELIIVIAIMVILVAVIAPQYLKYVNNSKISTDVQTAADLATAFNVAIADQSLTGSGTVSAVPTGVTNVSAMPVSRVYGTPVWKVTYNESNGVTKITLSNGAVGATDTTEYEVYPNPDDTAANGINCSSSASGTAKGLKK